MKVRFAPTARTQFLRGFAYIKRDNSSAALRLRDRSERVLRRLETHPESGRPIPEFPELPHREVIIKPCRFFYRIEGKTVWIVGVWHGAQLPGEPAS